MTSFCSFLVVIHESCSVTVLVVHSKIPTAVKHTVFHSPTVGFQLEQLITQCRLHLQC